MTIGEASTPAFAPAVTNAISSATGKRIRKLPIRTEDLCYFFSHKNAQKHKMVFVFFVPFYGVMQFNPPADTSIEAGDVLIAMGEQPN